MECFIRPAEPIAKKHLLSISCGPKSLNQVYVIIHVALSSLDIHHISDVVSFLIET